MSVSEASNEVQVWDNAACDSGGLERSVDKKGSWMDLDKQCLSASVEYDSSKENQNPLMGSSPAPFKTPVSNAMPINAVGGKMTGSGKIGSKKSASLSCQFGGAKGKKDTTLRDDAVIDSEIEQTEMEMSRLSLKLEALRLEKAERKLRIGERRGSIVPAKYMELKQSTNPKLGFLQKNQDTKPQRRGASLCPAEIYSATKSRQAMTKPDIGNSGVTQGRRQSCFWKLGEIDELKVTKVRGGMSASVSPKSRNPVPRFDAPKKAVTTIGSKKPTKKEVAVLSSVQPKKLFRDGEKSAPPKKPIKSGRVVPSRYNQNTAQYTSADCVAKLRSSSETEGRESVAGSESRVKKRWEIPAKEEVVVYKSDGESTPVVDEIADVLPKIRTVRCVNETPRDSGAVKRVADLVGKKSFFGAGEVDAEELGVRQALSFVDEQADDDAHN